MNERPSTSSKIEQQQIPSTSEETDTGTNSDETVVAKELTVSSRRNRRKRRKIPCGRRVLYMALTIAALLGVWAAAWAMSYSPYHDSVFSGFKRRYLQIFGFNNWTDFNENATDFNENATDFNENATDTGELCSVSPAK